MVLHCAVVYCIALYNKCIVLYCIVLYCIVLYCIVLYCINMIVNGHLHSQRVKGAVYNLSAKRDSDHCSASAVSVIALPA